MGSAHGMTLTHPFRHIKIRLFIIEIFNAVATKEKFDFEVWFAYFRHFLKIRVVDGLHYYLNTLVIFITSLQF